MPNHCKYPRTWLLSFCPRIARNLTRQKKMWRYFKDRVSMIAYNSLEMLQEKLSEITNQVTPEIIKSICGNLFYKETMRRSFNV